MFIKYGHHTMKLIYFLFLSIIFINISTEAATYKGQNIDGPEYSARAYSYGTHSYYYVKVVFDGRYTKVYFEGGEYTYLSLNNSDISDPHDIYAYDYEKHVNWHLNVDGLD
ncbi:MAG: hypothetical protein A2Y69_02490 [Candidatus Aminicenantes bacterium RBG_13_59_9]|nr:MAG: hypothetical protein A2Y69_02490 [Candidatus Aminicenantes bacterium RBG_13_59_9]